MIFYLMGKSASGKDKIYTELLRANAAPAKDAASAAHEPGLPLRPLVLYTTRPIRTGETDGQQYHFTDEAGLSAFRKEGKVIEERTYQTIAGPWTYATVDDGLDPKNTDYLAIGTLISYRKIRDYFGAGLVVPLYLDVSDANLLTRAMTREGKQVNPQYKEMCRRFLADSEDFDEANISAAGITKRYDNNGPLENCIAQIQQTINEIRKGGTAWTKEALAPS